MAFPSFPDIEAAIQKAWTDAEAKLEEYKAKLPAEVQPVVGALESIANEAIQSQINTIRDALVQQFVEQFIGGHGPVVKSGVDLA